MPGAWPRWQVLAAAILGAGARGEKENGARYLKEIRENYGKNRETSIAGGRAAG